MNKSYSSRLQRDPNNINPNCVTSVNSVNAQIVMNSPSKPKHFIGNIMNTTT